MIAAHEPQRLLCYRRMDHGYFGHVIVEGWPDGLRFFESEYGDVSWHRFTPSAEERQAVDLLLGWNDGRENGENWELLINVARLRQQAARRRSRAA
jgi:hypothetical protein